MSIDINEITSIDAAEVIEAAIELRQPTFIAGAPGIGKSQLVKSIADKLGAAFIDVRLSQCEPTDLVGIPYYNKDKNVMDWAHPVKFPTKEFAATQDLIVLFLDELNGASPAVQLAAYELILDRRSGTYELPDNVAILAAGNRDSDKGVTHRMALPLANRLMHIDMKADFAAWQEWAVNHGIHADIIGYLSASKQDLMAEMKNLPPNTRAFNSPRSWAAVSRVLDKSGLSQKSQFTMVSGLIGEGLTHKFMAHRKLVGKLPEASDVLSGKVTDLKVKEVSAMYSLTVSLCYELRDFYEKNGGKAIKADQKKEYNAMMDNFLTYAMANFETELVVMGARIAMKTYNLPIDAQALKCFKDFHQNFGKYILQTV